MGGCRSSWLVWKEQQYYMLMTSIRFSVVHGGDVECEAGN